MSALGVADGKSLPEGHPAGKPGVCRVAMREFVCAFAALPDRLTFFTEFRILFT